MVLPNHFLLWMPRNRPPKLDDLGRPAAALSPYTESMSEQQSVTTCDVTVIGGGLAGKAASLHLAKAGLKVICIEPAEASRQPVGESLDWSGPELLRELGLPMEEVIATQIGTCRLVTETLPNGTSVACQ